MGALYIKDDATADRVARMAEQRGTTKTALVGRALDALDQLDPVLAVPENDPEPADFVQWLRWHRARNPLPARTGRPADKAFFDRLWGEPD